MCGGYLCVMLGIVIPWNAIFICQDKDKEKRNMMTRFNCVLKFGLGCYLTPEVIWSKHMIYFLNQKCLSITYLKILGSKTVTSDFTFMEFPYVLPTKIQRCCNSKSNHAKITTSNLSWKPSWTTTSVCKANWHLQQQMGNNLKNRRKCVHH